MSAFAKLKSILAPVAPLESLAAAVADALAEKASIKAAFIRFQSEERRCLDAIVPHLAKKAAASLSAATLTGLFASEAAGEIVSAGAIASAEAAMRDDVESDRRAQPQIAGLESTAKAYATQAEGALADLLEIQTRLDVLASKALHQWMLEGRRDYRAACEAFAAGPFAKHEAMIAAGRQFARDHGLSDTAIWQANVGSTHILMPTSSHAVAHSAIVDQESRNFAHSERSETWNIDASTQIRERTEDAANALAKLLPI
jgi:hypothetical protein